jgi:TonB family protein
LPTVCWKQLGASAPYVPGSTGSGDTNEILKLDCHRSEASTTSPTTASSQGTTIAYEGDLIYQVKPAYPSLARSARMQGPVVLQAVIRRQGTIEHLRVLTGHPMSVRAAIDAVIRWRHRS